MDDDEGGDSPLDPRRWSVARCACGALTVTIGQARLRLSPIEFANLYRLLDAAMIEFGIPASNHPVLGRSVRH